MSDQIKPELPSTPPVAQPEVSSGIFPDLPDPAQSPTPASQPAPASQAAPVENAVAKNQTDYRRFRLAARMRLDGAERSLYGHAAFYKDPVRPRDEDDKRPEINFPSTSMASLSSKSEDLLAINYGNDSKALAWAETLDDGSALLTTNDAYIPTMAAEGSHFTQVPEYNGKKLVMGVTKMRRAEGQELTSNNAVMYAMGALGLGLPVSTPLWSSGWWVTFRPAGDDEWVAFNNRLSSLTALSARRISGLTMSNINAVFLEAALDFACSHIYATNIQFESTPSSGRQNYLRLLRDPDINTFLLAFLAACNSSGYPIARSCTSKIKECMERVSDTVDLQLLLVANTARLEERHLAHMSRNGPGQVTEAQIKEYQDTLLPSQERTVQIVNNELAEISAVLRVPTAEERVLAGNRWVNSITEMVNRVLSQDATTRQRDETFYQYTKASILREYSHWIKELHVNGAAIVNIESVENTLAQVTAHGTLRDTLYKTIGEYIEDSAIGIAALPNYNCPACGNPQKEVRENDHFKEAIALDVVQTFFSLARLRLVDVMSR